MKTFARTLLLLVSLSLLAACGPIFGQFTRGTDGVREFTVVQGSLASLKPGSQLLVFGPFGKTDKAFFVCRGEEETHFATELAAAGLFATDLYLEPRLNRTAATAAALRGKTPEQLKAELELDILPDQVLFATLLERESIIAPTRGVLMEIRYRLEFYDLRSGQSTVIETRVKHLAERCVPEVVAELKKRLAG